MLTRRRSFEPSLQNVGVEKGPSMRHVVEMQQTSTVGKHGIDVNILNIGQVRNSVFWQEQTRLE